jgi:hypothetical protein
MRLSPVQKIENISSGDFQNLLETCKPVILKDFVDPESPAFKKWNYDYFKEIAGDHQVNIYGSEIESWTEWPASRSVKALFRLPRFNHLSY